MYIYIYIYIRERGENDECTNNSVFAVLMNVSYSGNIYKYEVNYLLEIYHTHRTLF